MRHTTFVFSLLASLLTAAPTRASGQAPGGRAQFRIEETTIGDIHAAFRAGTLSCKSLVEQYLRRIDAYDKNGPAINALVVVNPAALQVADSLDRRFAREG